MEWSICKKTFNTKINPIWKFLASYHKYSFKNPPVQINMSFHIWANIQCDYLSCNEHDKLFKFIGKGGKNFYNGLSMNLNLDGRCGNFWFFFSFYENFGKFIFFWQVWNNQRLQEKLGEISCFQGKLRKISWI